MDKWINFEGVNCYYRIAGKGKTLMLVHGFIEDGAMWNGLITALSKSYRLIIPDLPGFGKSGVLPQVSMELYADYLQAIAASEKISRFVLLGHSMGGYVALSYAEKYGTQLAGFGLINSHCFEDSDTKKANRLKGIDFIKRHGTGVFVRELYYNIFEASFLKKNKKLVDGLIARAQLYQPEAVIAANAAMMLRSDKSAVLKNAPVPVLFINGSLDESAPIAYTLKQASYPGTADFNLFDNCKHMSVFERKAETQGIILSFCNRVL